MLHVCVYFYSIDPYGDGFEKAIRYSYNEKNQLLLEADSEIEKRYQYDLRGNMTEMAIGGRRIKQFIFDAANRMSSSAELSEDVIRKAEYRYNGLGQRVGQNIWRTGRKSTNIAKELIDVTTPEMPEEKISYTLDVTRACYNTLCLETGDKRQDFYWDGNVVAMEEGDAESYYILDDLGSPVRLLDGRGNSREIYGYDEFGADLCRKTGQPHRQIQPFGFTGYQMDEVGGMYFAQARRYDAGVGRFISEDFIKGVTTAPYTLNHYGYCWNRPLDLVDLDGLWAERLETGTKAVTVVVAVAAVIAVVATVATGGAVAALAIAAGAAVTGVINGLANETIGGSYINGWVGGAVSGGVQTAAGAGNPLRFIVAGGVNGIGSAITDVLDNNDPTNNKYKTPDEIYRDMRINEIKGIAYSIPGALIGAGVDGANKNPEAMNILMKNYNSKLGESLCQFYGVIDNLMMTSENFSYGNGGKNSGIKRDNEVKE